MDSKDVTEDPFDDDAVICSFDEYDKETAKERASVLWLLSKAFDGVIPTDLKEPFYRDHEMQRRLKPKIVHSLANADLYCLSLVNIYSDPNYHNLDHHGVIQALMRKGICLVESGDAPLTETILVQTAPIRLSAHLAVIEGIMSLYIKEVLIPEKIVEAVRGFAHVNVNSEIPSNPEEAAVLWINKCCTTLEQDIKDEFRTHEESMEKLPRIPVLQEISDISDGCSLAAVISFYCPNYLRWQDVCWNDPMSLGDSIYNLQLVKQFCCEHLSRHIDFLTLEDFLYVHPSIKDNVLLFVADLLYLFIIWPASCVTRNAAGEYEEPSQIKLESCKSTSNSVPCHKAQQLPYSPVPNLKTEPYGGSTSSLPEIRPGIQAHSPASQEKVERQNNRKTSLSNDRVEMSTQLQRTRSAGVVNGSKSIDTSPPSLSNSTDKNFRHFGIGGLKADLVRPLSNDDISKEADKSCYGDCDQVHKDSNDKENLSYSQRKLIGRPVRSFNNSGDSGKVHLNRDTHSSQGRLSTGLEDYYNQLGTGDGPIRSNSVSNIRENQNWKNSHNERPNFKVSDSSSSQSSGICISEIDNKNLSKTSFAKLSKLRDANSNAINIVYMQHDREGPGGDKNPLKSSFLQKAKQKLRRGEEKRATFATLPNTTTWQQQRATSSNSPQTDSGHETPTEASDPSLNMQLANIRMKLEEKRRRIELEKKRVEALWKRQRQKLGKAVFLQAVSRSGGSDVGTPDSGTGKDVCESETIHEKKAAVSCNSPSMVRRMSIQDIAEDLEVVQKKWFDRHEPSADHSSSVDTATDGRLEVSDPEAMNVTDFQTSMEQLNSSLNDLQTDIHRISFQQEHVHNLMQDSVEDITHFYLHGHSMDSEQPESPSVQNSFQWGKTPIKVQHEQNGQLPPVLMSSHRQPYLSQSAMSPQKVPSSRQDPPPLPPKPLQNHDKVNTEELYSKVIKPENRRKSNLSKQQYSLPDQPCPNDVNESQHIRPASTTSQDRNQSVQYPPQNNGVSHTSRSDVLQHSPEEFSPWNASQHNASGQNFHRKKLSVENDQGFYIPLDNHSKKPKSKWKKQPTKNEEIVSHVDVPLQRNLVSAGNIACQQNSQKNDPESQDDANSFGFVIGADFVHPDPDTEVEMARKKEMIMTLSIKRRVDHENRRAEKEQEYARLREEEQRKREYQDKKRDEERHRREAILEQYRQKKLQDELEKESAGVGSTSTSRMQGAGTAKSRSRPHGKQRPKSAYSMTAGGETSYSVDGRILNKRNSQFIFSGKENPEFDVDSLNSTSTSNSSRDRAHSPSSGRLSSCQTSPTQRSAESGGLQVPEVRGPSSDGASDTASNSSVAAEYTGPKLFVKPTAKSNRGIITNAINTVLAGAVNKDTKRKVLEEINRSESKHFLILFRDAGCQFRALYSYNPDREEVMKMFGIGPKSVTDKMMDRFYKYNSGGKCFSEVQTKHLTVTIDAFTIPNSLWAGKKVIPPRKEFF